MRVLKWFGIAGLAAIALTSKVDPAYASDDSSWPHRPITIVLSQPAGSSPDIIARILAERMSEILKQPIVIDNRGGGQNVIGAMHAQRARPDGYTYYLGTAAAMATNPYTLKNLPYDPLKDFEPVGLVGISPFLVVTRADVPAKSLAELIQLSKDTPDGLNFASDGQYGFGSMIGEWLKRATDLKFVNVPYTGAAGAVQDLMGAHSHFTIVAIPPVRQFIEQGALRPLAVTTAERQPGLKDIPPIAETVPGVDFAGWFALFAPTGPPTEAIARMNEALDQALVHPAAAERIKALGIFTPGAGTPEELRAFVQKELEVWGRTIKEIGLEPQ